MVKLHRVAKFEYKFHVVLGKKSHIKCIGGLCEAFILTHWTYLSPFSIHVRPKARCDVCWHWWNGHPETGSQRSCRASTHTLWALQAGQICNGIWCLIQIECKRKKCAIFALQSMLSEPETLSYSWTWQTIFGIAFCNLHFIECLSDRHWPPEGCPHVRTPRLW